MIPIVKPFLPPLNKYSRYLEGVYQRNWLTNNGPLCQELTMRLEAYLGIDNLLLVANGTLALQVALRTFEFTEGDVITTPFTFAASPGALKWQNMQPRFVDIEPGSFNLAPELIAPKVTNTTKAIMPVHVFGNPCQVEEIEQLANQHKLNVIYDAAHTFGSTYKNEALLQYGDASTISFHATKSFHCVEGGAISFKRKEDLEKAKRLINFGFNSGNYPSEVGINAKLSEFHAAMGLAMLDHIDGILAHRKAAMSFYQSELNDLFTFQEWSQGEENNGAYAPIILQDESTLIRLVQWLESDNIQSRRYFYPSLNSVAVYGDQTATKHSENISKRILCLPISGQISEQELKTVTQSIKRFFD